MDKVAEMLTKIRNAQMARHAEVKVPSSKLKLAIVKTLEKEGFIGGAFKEKEESLEFIKIILKYKKIGMTGKFPAISGIRRISRLGQRKYIKKDEIRKVKNGFGVGVISTSRGVLTDREAKKMGLGGEYICEVW
jgi:small subunit ribosomal protein S8